MEILKELPLSKSGYYWVKIGNKDAQVYCDMENYGMHIDLSHVLIKAIIKKSLFPVSSILRIS